ncbi:hypothetical protein KR51_00029880 [Rubidibacter lacunae KORDI 51-2]|uniref:Uncharacterized protein n=1 Tax=Rubidibacter lacunae KORDI 51-2 TaxID=582515 RepID=U5DGN9_9CHRO|nr:hypothetical protein [Rubidibacter lacunae]ERN40447.1 hypothetical protein KR51_00029880 [Rubidibacter lacunae KORDI 51-2]
MPRTPDEYAVYLLLSTGHREEVRFQTLQDFQKWYSGELKANAESNEFINVPLRTIEGEYMVVRPACVVGIRVEPVFSGSVERY